MGGDAGRIAVVSLAAFILAAQARAVETPYFQSLFHAGGGPGMKKPPVFDVESALRCTAPDSFSAECTPFNFRGQDGRTGVSGRKGVPGFSNGGPGARGQDGRPAGLVRVEIRKTEDKMGKAYLEVLGRTDDRNLALVFALPLPADSTIHIAAQGGRGGAGGRGGMGFQGCASHGPDGHCRQWENGRDGSGGSGGNGGDGARVVLAVYPGASDFVRHIAIHASGGLHGSGGWGFPHGHFGRHGAAGSVLISEMK